MVRVTHWKGLTALQKAKDGMVNNIQETAAKLHYSEGVELMTLLGYLCQIYDVMVAHRDHYVELCLDDKGGGFQQRQ